ncbi:MAG: DoxX family protein [Polyangiaceae bacterium]
MSTSIAAVSPRVSAAPRPSRALHISLWVAQILLALVFGMAGAMKTFTPLADLAKSMPLAAIAPAALVRFIGISELAGALGLILPAATRIKPWLTPLAAGALFVVMVLAIGFHASRGEMQALPVNVVLGALAAFVAWGRFKRAPVEPR